MNKKLILIITIAVITSSFTTFALTSEYPCEWYFWRDYDTDTLEEDYYDPECGMYDLIFKKRAGVDIFSGEVMLTDPSVDSIAEPTE